MRKAIFITVRLKSRRLPKKALAVIEGRTMIEHLIDRLKHSKFSDLIVLCTSINHEDDPLIEIARKNGIKCFRRSESDVLSRLLGAAEQEKVDFIVSVTGDNPLTDPEYIDGLIELQERTGADYVKCEDLPLGTNAHGMTTTALRKVCKLKSENDTEIWGLYFTNTGMFHVETLEVEDGLLKHPEIRLTVDHKEDLDLMKDIFRNFYAKNRYFTLKSVMGFLLENQELLAKNKNIEQRRAPKVDLKGFTDKALCGERIRLRSMNESDLEKKAQWANDLEINKYLGLKLPITIESTKEWFNKKIKDASCKLFTIETKNDERQIGFMRLDIEYKDKKGQLHLVIGEKDYWNGGYGTEATKIFLNYCFSFLELNKVYLYVLKSNMAAVRVYEKCGFKTEGTLIKDAFINNRFEDRHIMSIIKEDYEKDKDRK